MGLNHLLSLTRTSNILVLVFELKISLSSGSNDFISPDLDAFLILNLI